MLRKPVKHGKWHAGVAEFPFSLALTTRFV